MTNLQSFEREDLVRFNPYVCRTCGEITLTAHTRLAQTGVTPAFLRCRAGFDYLGPVINPITAQIRENQCDGMAASGWYPAHIPDEVMALPVWVWHFPDDRAFGKMSPDMQAHVSRGGAALTERPIP